MTAEARSNDVRTGFTTWRHEAAVPSSEQQIRRPFAGAVDVGPRRSGGRVGWSLPLAMAWWPAHVKVDLNRRPVQTWKAASFARSRSRRAACQGRRAARHHGRRGRRRRPHRLTYRLAVEQRL
jgi:hypothetical protein